MPRPNFLLTSLVVCTALLLTGAIPQQPAPSAQLDQTAGARDRQRPGPASEDKAATPEALALLDRAIVVLGPERVHWLETTLWQQVDCDDFHYQVRGRFLAAPGHRLRLQMQVRVGETRGQWQIVSDGRTLSQLYQVSAGVPSITHSHLPAAQPGQNAAALLAAREQFLQAQGVAGVRPLLQLIRARLQEAHTETISWDGREVVRVTGGWPADAKLASLPQGLQTPGVPRHCRVFLDARTLWPYRVEWWGASASARPMTLLSQTEFRQAVLNRVLPPERCAREFTFVPPS